MHTGAKIDFHKYVFFSVLLLVAAYFLTRSMSEFYVMLTVFVAACLNQWMLVNVVKGVTQNAATGEPLDKLNMIILIVTKVAIVIAALTFGVQIMGNRIIIPVLIYVLQIAVLYLSLNKTGVEKGSK